MMNVHILFSESAAGGLKWALKDSDPAQKMKIIGFPDYFAIGPIFCMRNYSVRLAKHPSAMDDNV